MTIAAARPNDGDSLPIIDITPLRTGEDARGVAEALHAASQGLGFIYVKGHGIPEAAFEDARNAAYAFFRSESGEKSAVTVSQKHRGWLGRGGAKMDDDAPADLKESFIWGIENEAGETPEDHALRGANQWPGHVPGFRDAAMRYFWAAHDVARHLMRGFAIGLDRPADFFLRTDDKPLSRASFVYYPPQESGATGQYGVGPHTDFGVLTVLCQDMTGGLEVRTVNGDWIAAPPIDGTLVVNVGDLLSRWTDGAYVSTPHRVRNTSGRERLSLVLAYDPNPETMIDARSVFGESHAPAEPPIACGDYLVKRFERAFSYRTQKGG